MNTRKQKPHTHSSAARASLPMERGSEMIATNTATTAVTRLATHWGAGEPCTTPFFM